jgi:hypothetical protein
LEEVMPSLYGFAKEQDAINTKKCIGGLPYNCFLFTINHELQIPLDVWPSNTPQHSYDILGARMLWKPKEARILKNFKKNYRSTSVIW